MPGVLLAGLPGTGKTTLGHALAERLGGHVLNKDVVREATFGPRHVEYSRPQDDFVEDYLVAAAHWLWQRDPGLWIFFDGRVFGRAEQRRKMPAEHILLLEAAETLVRERLLEPHVAANRNRALYERLRDEFEPIAEPHLVIDSGRPLEECVEQALAYLLARVRS